MKTIDQQARALEAAAADAPSMARAQELMHLADRLRRADRRFTASAAPLLRN